MSSSDILINAARAAVGTKFRHQGRLIGHGLDCAGLIVHCAATAGYAYVDRLDYPRLPRRGELEAALEMQPCLKKIPIAQACAGDVLLVRFGKSPQHLALHAGTMMIHAWEQVGKVCEHAIDGWKDGEIVAAYRFCEPAP